MKFFVLILSISGLFKCMKHEVTAAKKSVGYLSLIHQNVISSMSLNKFCYADSFSRNEIDRIWSFRSEYFDW